MLGSPYQLDSARRGVDDVYGQLSELQEVRIEGCKVTLPEQILGVIQSRESELSVTRNLAKYYSENVRRNPSTPAPIQKTLDSVHKALQDELRYFNASRAADDSVAILEYLDQNGFHLAKVKWDFFRDHDARKNVLRFVIQEGPQARIDTLILLGLDDLPPDIRSGVLSRQTVGSGDAFTQNSLVADLLSITRTLQDNGYYRASFRRPIFKTTSDFLHDSVAVVFLPGPRKRIGAISLEENANGYPEVSESMRRRQLEFSEGDWYSRTNIERSRANLMGLGVFEVATIDTLEASMMRMSADSTLVEDTTLILRVFTLNNKPSDLGANLLLYQTAVDNYVNFGGGLTYQHRNVFGGAQLGYITAQYVLQDISRLFQGLYLEREALLQGVLAWPSAFRIWDWRAGLQTNAYYSDRQLVNPFRLQSIGVGGKLPISLPQKLAVNGLDLNLGLERQVPREFQERLDSALSEATTPEEIAYVYSTFNQFLILDNYLKTTGRLLTGVFVGANVRLEHRDNPIDPRKGQLGSISIEYGFGAGHFLRSQVFITNVIPLSDRLGFAAKLRAGHIFLFEFTQGSPTDTNTYVPLDRQFFSGGSASIRSYQSRALHDPNSGFLPFTDNEQRQVLDNTIGSATLLELSFELRFRFPKPSGWQPLWASMVDRSGLTLFSDFGNAFNRLTLEKYGTIQTQDLILGSVWAGGLGYRFETPVGPFRVDFATSIYDPNRTGSKWLFSEGNTPFAFSSWMLQIGLGHPF
jgi:outer membrane protein assembly factor BamA